ncbi:unnamed protein product, partial [Mesocestoides corti]|uniref:GDSL esterase/lipase n=1 Tax=Mesocestoides corti TaxID=53468 RepID=A0A0R3UCV6_MESCO
MQTLVLRFAHLGDSITTYYTDLLLGHVWSSLYPPSPEEPPPPSPSPLVIPSMSQVVGDFIVPLTSTARLRKLRGKKCGSRHKRGDMDEKHTPPVGRLLAMASRLLCLTRNRFGRRSQEVCTSAQKNVPIFP